MNEVWCDTIRCSSFVDFSLITNCQLNGVPHTYATVVQPQFDLLCVDLQIAVDYWKPNRCFPPQSLAFVRQTTRQLLQEIFCLGGAMYNFFNRTVDLAGQILARPKS